MSNLVPISNQLAITRATFAQLLGHDRQWAYTRRSLPPLTKRGTKRVITLADAQAWIEAEMAKHETKLATLKAAQAKLSATLAIERWRKEAA
jgi:hypothetical protein